MPRANEVCHAELPMEKGIPIVLTKVLSFSDSVDPAGESDFDSRQGVCGRIRLVHAMHCGGRSPFFLRKGPSCPFNGKTFSSSESGLMLGRASVQGNASDR